MKFKTQQDSSQTPDVNLVPMMDVLMAILTFFIVISMTLSGQQQALNVILPSTQAGTKAVQAADPLIVSLNPEGQITIQDKTTTEAQLTQQIQTYLVQNPEGTVLLRADRQVVYEQIAKLLGTMQQIGGERVSLAIENN